MKTLSELETNFGQEEFVWCLLSQKDCIQTALCRLFCPQKSGWAKPKSSLSHCSWKSWFLSFPCKCDRFTQAWLWSYSQWELSGYTKHHKEPKTTKIQNKKVAITLETRQSLEDSPSEKPLGATWTECFESVQHKLLSKPATPEWGSSLLGKMHDIIYTGTHTHSYLFLWLQYFLLSL